REKLAAIGNPQALVFDYEQYGVGEAQKLIGRTIRLASGILVRDSRQLMPQLLGRLIGCQSPEMPAFLDTARRLLVPPVILSKSLTPPGAESARLEGHSDAVSALCVLPDGRLARVGALCVLPDGRLAWGSSDHPLRLWDVKTGAESARLEGHSVSVNALCVLSDGRLASGSRDNTICLR